MQARIFDLEVNEELTLKIKMIPRLIMQRFKQDWEKKNPKPEPPKIEVKIVNTALAQADDKNEYYKEQVADWEEARLLAILEFLFSRSVVSEPPKKWESDYPELIPENPTSEELKMIWLSEVLVTSEDLERFQEGIMSLGEPTQKGIEEAEKN